MKRRTLSAGAVVVRFQGEEPRYLLLRAYNHWDFPKGEVEPGEEPLDAAQREVREETTLTGLVFHWGECYRETGPYRRGKVARYYLAEAPSGDVRLPVSPELGRPEHHEFRWVDYRTGLGMLSPRVEPVLRWAHGIVSGDTAARSVPAS